MKTIKEYQTAYNSIIDELKNNSSVLGVTVFGSIMTGDIWKNSDIDLFVIVEDNSTKEKDIYAQKFNIDIHMKILTKNEFLNFRENFVGGGKLHRKLISSKLVIANDREIIDKYNYYKFLNDNDKERWNLLYLGELIRAKGLCDKAISNGKIYNAIYSSLKLGESVAKIYLNLNGYLISSDPLTMAISLNDDFKNCMDKVIADSNKESIENLIFTTEMFLSKNIKNIASLLLKKLKEAKKPLSINEIKNIDEFIKMPIEFDKILRELYQRNIVKRGEREIFISNEKKLAQEVIYYYEN
ncbi:MAG: nucleotidyltransferase domain-containing protein [Sarcina sp.]